MSDYFCANCGYADLDLHGRCSKCGGDHIAIQVPPSEQKQPQPEQPATFYTNKLSTPAS